MLKDKMFEEYCIEGIVITGLILLLIIFGPKDFNKLHSMHTQRQNVQEQTAQFKYSDCYNRTGGLMERNQKYGRNS